MYDKEETNKRLAGENRKLKQLVKMHELEIEMLKKRLALYETSERPTPASVGEKVLESLLLF